MPAAFLPRAIVAANGVLERRFAGIDQMSTMLDTLRHLAMQFEAGTLTVHELQQSGLTALMGGWNGRGLDADERYLERTALEFDNALELVIYTKPDENQRTLALAALKALTEKLHALEIGAVP